MAELLQSTAYTRMFMLILASDHISPATGKSPVVNISKAGAAFGAAAGTVTEVSGGWYKVALTSADTGTLGDLAYHITEAASDNTDFCDQVYAAKPSNTIQWNGTAVATPATAGIPDVNTKNINNVAAATPGASGGLLIAGTNAATTFNAGMTISNAAGNALTLSSSGSNGSGLSATGNGSGAGVTSTGGATGAGMFCQAGGGNSAGFEADGAGTGSGVYAFGGTTGDGVKCSGGGTGGHGMNLIGTGSNKHGLLATGGTGGVSDGIKGAAGSGGVDIRGAITGNVTGNLSGSAGSVTGAVGSVAAGGIARAAFAADTGLVTIRSNTAQAGAAGTITLDAAASATTDFYKGLRILLTGGAGVGQVRTITAYNGGTQVATVDWNWITNPDVTTTFALLAADGPSVNSSLQVATTASDPWSTALPGAYGAGTAGNIVGNNLNATVSSRMATYTQPTGFLAATFPSGTIANTTNITAGTITNATNVTNRVTANADQVAGDATAATNLASTFNGTGYTAATAPATQSQVSNIAVTGAALNATAASRTLTTGTETNAYTDTFTDDGVYHTITSSAGTIDIYYEFSLGSTGQTGVGTYWQGYVGGILNSIKVYAYNWGAAGWDQVGTLLGISNTVESDADFALTSAHTGTGGNLGKVRIRFQNTGLTAATLNTDRLLVGYAVVVTYPTNFSALGIGAGGHILNVDTLTTYTGDTPQTGDSFARLGAPAGTSIAADLAEIEAETDGIAAIPTSNPSAAAIATAVWQDATAGDFTAASSIGKGLYTSGAVPGASGGLFIAGSNAATTVNITGNLTGNVTGSVGSLTTNNDKTGYSLAVTPPTAAAIATAIWQDLLAGSDFGTAASIGKLLKDDIDTNIGSRSTYAGGAVASVTAGVTVTTNNDKTGYSLSVTPPTAAAIATTVWQDLLAGADFGTAGSIGALLKLNVDAKISAAGGDPWATAIPGAYGAGTAGNIVGNNLNATVSSRLATSGYTAPLDAAGTRAAVGLASANLDAQIAEIAAETDNIAAVKAKTDNLPASPAAAADIAAALATTTYGEPTGAPQATTTLEQKVGFLYEVLRNKLTVTAGAKTFYDGSGSAQWSKVLADNGTTYSEAQGS